MVGLKDYIVCTTKHSMLTRESLASILDTNDFFNFDTSDGVYILFGPLRNKEKDYFDDNGISYEYDDTEHYTVIDTTKVIRDGESLPY